ncbi:AEC family transporter [Rhodoligotrophos defluvii]|uniref:AEC family transporter n=1 Tax=Rhodoligotrophos defluvii TaxID=2561934 RepID=UPI0010C986F7|nr:AEC family transporter [Rhodoligotrophos defluvii]
MVQALDTIVPVFGLIVIGFLLSKAGVFGKMAAEGLSTVVFTLCMPALLFKTMIGITLPQVSPWGLWGSYFGAVAIAWIMGWAAVALLFRRDARTAAVAGVGAAYANTMLMGLPIIFAVMGNAGALPLFLIIAVHLPIMSLFATIQLEWAQRSQPGVRLALLGSIAKGVASNPITIGLGAGLLWRFTGLALPSAPAKVLDMLSEASVPCALLAMGTALSHYSIRGSGGPAVAITLIKLVVHPLAVWLLARYVFHIPSDWMRVAVLFAAAPTGINTFIFAVRYQAAIGMISGAIALGTILSVLSFSLALWATGP